jgi:hypothetical protein
MSDEGYLLDNQGSEAGQRFDAPAGLRGSARQRCIDRLCFAVRSVRIQQFIARRCRRLARHRLRPLT